MDDRRLSTKFKTDLPARIESPVGPEILKGRILNISSSGLLLLTDHAFGEGAPLSIKIMGPHSDTPLTINGEVKWMSLDDQSNKHQHGISIIDPQSIKDEIDLLLNSLESMAPVSDRRKVAGPAMFPVLRRRHDYAVLAERNPYDCFFRNLQGIAKSADIRTIVVGRGLHYLSKRIRSVFPEPRLISVDKVDNKIGEGVLVVLGIDCRRRHEPVAYLDFDEYYAKGVTLSEPIRTLTHVSRAVSEGSTVHFLSIGGISNKSLATKILSVAKFSDTTFRSPHHFSAVKRSLLQREFGNGAYILREVETEKEIEEIQTFAAGVFAGERNFVKTIDGLFNNHSDFYSVHSKISGELINFARVTNHLPGLVLPCMLATKRNTDQHLILDSPDDVSYGEVFSPYIKSLTAAKVYSELVKVIVSYGESGRINVMFTTYDERDQKALAFFSQRLGFCDTRVSLNYGTFGGDWGLIFCSRDSFRQTIALQFSSQRKPSHLIEALQ